MAYYKDGVPVQMTIELHKLLWPTEHLAPLALVVNLDEVVGHKLLIGNPLLATAEDLVEKASPNNAKTRKQKKDSSRRAKARTSVELMADAATVKLNDTTHRDKGWWAVDTANPNAWEGPPKS